MQLFLHIGAQVSVAIGDVVAVLDMEIAEKSSLAAEFFSRAREEHTLLAVDGQKPRCAVITPSAVYLSSISLPTLRRRLEAASGDLEHEEDERSSHRRHGAPPHPLRPASVVDKGAGV